MAASLAALVLLLASVLGPWESAFQATKWSQHSGAGLAYSCYVGNDGNLMQSATLVGEEGDVVEAGEQEGSEAWSDARERGCLGETSTRTTVQCHPSRVVQQTSIRAVARPKHAKSYMLGLDGFTQFSTMEVLLPAHNACSLSGAGTY